MEDIWYSGLRVAERRPITAEDLAAIDRLRRNRKMRTAISLLGGPLLALVGSLAAWLFDLTDALRLAYPGAVVFALSLRPWRVVPACSRQLDALHRDADGGEIVICKGIGCELVFTMNEEKRLTPQILVHSEPDERLTIELLPNSGAILTVNDMEVHSWNEAQQGATAAKSDHAKAAAHFIQQHPNEDGTAIGSRALSAEELTELIAHAPPVSQIDLLLMAGVVLLAFVAWWHTFATRNYTIALPVLGTIAAIWLSARTLRRWRMHRRFARDIGIARVVIVHQEDDEETFPVEYLPFSGALWTYGHIPTTWRRLPLSRKTFVRREPG